MRLYHKSCGASAYILSCRQAIATPRHDAVLSNITSEGNEAQCVPAQCEELQ